MYLISCVFCSKIWRGRAEYMLYIQKVLFGGPGCGKIHAIDNDENYNLGCPLRNRECDIAWSYKPTVGRGEEHAYSDSRKRNCQLAWHPNTNQPKGNSRRHCTHCCFFQLGCLRIYYRSIASC